MDIIEELENLIKNSREISGLSNDNIFEIGDWITTYNDGSYSECTSNGISYSGAGFVHNITLKIKRIDYSDFNKRMVYFFEDYDYGIYAGNFRKATLDEIKPNLK